MRIFILLALTMGLLITSCEKNPIDTDQAQLADAQKQLLQNSNDFGIVMLKQMNNLQAETQENIFISPLSISMALGMAANGADGSTQDAILDAMQVNTLNISDANQAYSDMKDRLPQVDPDVRVDVANSIWYRNGFSILSPFLQVNQLYYGAQVSGQDFTDPNTVNVINDWVSTNTNGLIPTIVDRISDDQVMFLINAVYFKANWTTRFDARNTQAWPFRLSDGTVVNADLMSDPNLPYSYYTDNDVEVADIPYANGAYSMTVILPSDNSTANDVINNLTTAKWNNWLTNLDTNNTPILYLPKLEIAYESSLKEPLTALGMGNAFSSSQANFSNISDQKMFINNVKHKTYLKVDEEGTEAAAVTSVDFITTSVPPSMLINKPYILAIRERESGSILFIGKIENPTL